MTFMLGMSREELIGRRMSEVLVDERTALTLRNAVESCISSSPLPHHRPRA